MSKLAMLAAALVSTTSVLSGAFASGLDDVAIGYPAMGGTGCPAGSASIALSPDAKTLSVLFDSFQVEAAGATRTQRKSCDIAIPLHVPSGMTVSVYQIDYRGFNSLPGSGAWSRINSSYFIPGSSQSLNFSKLWQGPMDDDYLFSTPLTAQSLVWSPCGADINMRSKVSMQVSTNAYGEQALSTVDSIDMNASMLYHLNWNTCPKR